MNAKVTIGGIYRHYKQGALYKVIGLARIESEGENGELQVVYQKAFDASSTMWVRPLSKFTEHITSTLRRFTLMNP